MLEEIASALKEQCKLDPGALIVAGVSGGPDSLCLLHALHALGYGVIAAHFDHQLRPESGSEAQAVWAIAAGLGVAFEAGSADVGSHAEQAHLSVEEAARELRYRFLFDVARQHGARAVAVGHTADDQVETVLMHLIRGSGMTGLAGMSMRTVLKTFDAEIPLLRPLLSVWRSQTTEYCAENGLTTLLDPSNESQQYFRNRIRAELVPLLSTYNPRIRQGLLRAARALASDLSLLEEYVASAWSKIVREEGDSMVSFDASRLAAVGEPMVRRIMLSAARRLAPNADMDFDTVQRAVQFVLARDMKQVDLDSGLVLFREQDSIRLRKGQDSSEHGEWPQLSEDSVPIPTGLNLIVPLNNAWQFSAEYVQAGDDPLQYIPRDNDNYCVAVDAGTLPEDLELRVARPGDRLRPLGMAGHSQKLSDLLINSRVPKRARQRWPLLCSTDLLIWVPGYRVAEAVRLRPETRRIARFAITRRP